MDELALPRRVGEQLACAAHGHKLHVAHDLLPRGRIHVDGLHVGHAQRQQSREVVALAVEDLRDGHLLVVKVHAPAWRWRAALRVRVDASGHRQVLAEEELLLSDCVALLRAVHVFVHLGDGHEEVEVEGEDGARDEEDEHGEGGIFKVRHLDLHGAELRAPANVGHHGWRGLPAHRVPVGALEALKVVRVLLVVEVYALAEDHEGVPREVVGDVARECGVDASLLELGEHLWVDLQAEVVELVKGVGLVLDARRGAGVDVVGDAAVPRLGQAAHALSGEGRVTSTLRHQLALVTALGRRSVVHCTRNHIPAAVRVHEAALEHGRGGGEGEENGRQRGELVREEAALVHVTCLEGDLQAAGAHPKRHRVRMHLRPRCALGQILELRRGHVRVEGQADVHVAPAARSDVGGERVHARVRVDALVRNGL
mmetsp:Transcript_7375/g.20088  ORF Transcript_7375/g.20088 Transcript_7375/m.20088 type:complete len:427 (+) Transcript_7375:759-2039(+)